MSDVEAIILGVIVALNAKSSCTGFCRVACTGGTRIKRGIEHPPPIASGTLIAVNHWNVVEIILLHASVPDPTLNSTFTR